MPYKVSLFTQRILCIVKYVLNTVVGNFLHYYLFKKSCMEDDDKVFYWSCIWLLICEVATWWLIKKRQYWDFRFFKVWQDFSSKHQLLARSFHGNIFPKHSFPICLNTKICQGVVEVLLHQKLKLHHPTTVTDCMMLPIDSYRSCVTSTF